MNRNQQGYSFIELAVSIAIIALVSTAAALAIFQIFKGTERNNQHLTVVRQVQNAGYWIGRDAQMAGQ
jgi:prepilin-type N-terminal cleavage/methylation domain-containing protein